MAFDGMNGEQLTWLGERLGPEMSGLLPVSALVTQEGPLNIILHG